MWLLKLKALRQRHQAVNKAKPIVISKVVIIAVPLLFLIVWYPNVIALHHTHSLLKKDLARSQKQHVRLQKEVDNGQDLSWLNNYHWLTWHLDKGNAEVIGEPGEAKRRVVQLSLQGATSYTQWHLVIDRLQDTSHFQPIATFIEWQLNGEFSAKFTLQRTSSVFDLPIFVVPKRINTPWPKEMIVSTAVYWNDEWRANLSLLNKTVYLRQGLWLPELAATLIDIDAKSATFRQQYILYGKTLDSVRETVSSIEKTVYYAFAMKEQEKGSTQP